MAKGTDKEKGGIWSYSENTIIIHPVKNSTDFRFIKCYNTNNIMLEKALKRITRWENTNI